MDYYITVIVPVYNNKQYLNKCVESLINQTLHNIEILLVDDGSTDGSSEVCDMYAAIDSRIRVIHKENEGLGLTRNVGLEEAKGEYFTFLDSDDYVDLDAYRTLWEQAKKYDADICFGGSTSFYDDGRCYPVRMQLDKEFYQGNEIREKIVPQIIGSSPEAKNEAVIGYSLCTGIYRLNIVKQRKMKFYSEREFKLEDVLFKIEYYTYANSVTYIGNPYYYYRCNQASLSRAYRKDAFLATLKSYQKEFSLLYELGYADGKLYAARMLLSEVRSCMRAIMNAEGFKKAVIQYREIADNQTLREIISNYPYQKNPFGKRVFNYCLDKKKVYCIATLIAINLKFKK